MLALAGGNWNNGSNAGLSNWNLNNSSGKTEHMCGIMIIVEAQLARYDCGQNTPLAARASTPRNHQRGVLLYEGTMILTKHVMYKGKQKRVEDLSPTCAYKVDVQCPECGEVRNVYYKSICRAGHTICQACSVKVKLSKQLEAGAKFGRLTVLHASSRRGQSVCQCECGTLTEAANWSIENGETKSCGCLRAEQIKRVSHNPSGDKHHNWKGGVAGVRASVMAKKAYKSWRAGVFERDGYLCQKCAQRGGKLRAHHIFNFADYPALRLDPDNGITLCDECHKRLHSAYGLKTNRAQLDEFIGAQTT